jgi:hypothetical protein
LRDLTEDEKSWLHYNPNTGDVIDFMQAYAREALRAQAASVPVGWKLVPVKCTSAMKDVGISYEYATVADGRLLAQSMWNELLAATPAPSPAPVAQEAADTGADERIERALGQFYMGVSDSDKTPYPGMAEAFEGHFGQSWQDRDWRQEASTWAAAWRKAWDQRAALAARAGQVAAPAMVPLPSEAVSNAQRTIDPASFEYAAHLIAEFCRINGLTVGGSKAGGDK